MSVKHLIEYKLIVENGENADRVIDSLKYVFSDKRLTVEFTGSMSGMGLIPTASTWHIAVTAVRYESGREGSLLIEGFEPNNPGTRVHGFYDAQRRVGTLTRTNQ